MVMNGNAQELSVHMQGWKVDPRVGQAADGKDAQLVIILKDALQDHCFGFAQQKGACWALQRVRAVTRWRSKSFLKKFRRAEHHQSRGEPSLVAQRSQRKVEASTS